MLEKIAAFAKTKAAVALLGVAVVGGGGGAVAVAATSGHLSTMGVNLNDSHGDNEGDHTSVEGLLTGCTASSVSVKSKEDNGKSWTFRVTSTTKFNGDVKADSTAGASTAKPEATETGDHTGASTGDSSTSKGTETGDHAGSSTSKGTETGDKAGSSTEKDGTGDSKSHQVTLAEVCATANINTRDVQVQATKTSSGYDAVKVTLQGPDSEKSEGSSSNEGTTSHAGSSTGDSSESGTATAKP